VNPDFTGFEIYLFDHLIRDRQQNFLPSLRSHYQYIVRAGFQDFDHPTQVLTSIALNQKPDKLVVVVLTFW
jgi:hypothetical protein